MRYNAGWRTHHVIKEVRRNILTVQVEKEDIYFLTVVIENHPEALKEESILTVSEESLKGTGLHGHNYEYILSSAELREVLSNNYKDEYGVPIKVIFIYLFILRIKKLSRSSMNYITKQEMIIIMCSFF